MDNQNLPVNQNTSLQETNVVPPPVPPQEPTVPETSSVVVPNGGGGVPGWFYFIFGLTLIVFLVVTTLLVLQITHKEPTASVVPTNTPQVTSAKLPTPTATSMDPAVAKLDTLNSSDDVSSIETDLKNTDLETWNQAISSVEAQINNSP